MKARIRLQKDCIISPIDPPRVWLVHRASRPRCLYRHLWPGHPTADAFGFRGDVEELIRPLHVTQIRYPGGKLPDPATTGATASVRRTSVPLRPDMAWSAIEPNQVGTDEFLQWCERIARSR